MDVGIMEALDPGKDKNMMCDVTLRCTDNVQSPKKKLVKTKILSLLTHHIQLIPYGRRVEYVVEQETQIL